MLPALRSWLYAPTLRRLYTTPTTTQSLQNSTRTSKPQYSFPKISTLRAERLVHSDFLVFAGKTRPSFHTKLSYRTPPNTHLVKYTANIRMTTLGYQSHAVYKRDSESDEEEEGSDTESDEWDEVERIVQVHAPFPECAQGFLYLHQPPPESGLERSACSIRFRCVPSLVETSSSYAASLKGVKLQSVPGHGSLILPSIKNRKTYKAFGAGYDLTLQNGSPWSIPVIDVASRPYLKYIRAQLVEDKLFSEKEMQAYEVSYETTSITRESYILRAPDDVFTVRFQNAFFTVWNMEKVRRTKWARQAVPKRGAAHIKPHSSMFEGVFMDRRPEHGNKMPYTGTAHVRFELAPGSKRRKPALSLRIVKITEPVECVIPDYDGYIHMPKEGELVTLGLLGGSKPWIYKLDPHKQTRPAIWSLMQHYVPNAKLR